jgi:hypothetical protein
MPLYTDSFDSSDSFWSDARSEPKRKYRFTFDVAGLPIWTITKVSRPSFRVTETKHDFYNHSFYYPGRVEWQTLSFTTVDPINPDATGIMMKMLYASGYEFPDKQFGGLAYNYKSLNKSDSVDSLNPVCIRLYDGQGATVEKWTLKNAFITQVTNGEVAYNDDNMVNIDVTLRYDWATIEYLGNRAPYTSANGQVVGDAEVGP